MSILFLVTLTTMIIDSMPARCQPRLGVGQAHHEGAAAEPVDKLAEMIFSDNLQPGALFVRRRVGVPSDGEQIERILRAKVHVVVQYVHRRHPVGIEVPDCSAASSDKQTREGGIQVST